MLTKIAWPCGLALAMSFLLVGDALACWVCEPLFPPPGCSYHCVQDPFRRGAVYCTDACSTCIMSGNCQLTGPQTLEADGTAIQEPAPDPLAGFFTPAVAVRRPVPFAGLGALVADATSRLGAVRRTCRGVILERVVSEGRRDEIRLEARRIVV